jgi:EpsG family
VYPYWLLFLYFAIGALLAPEVADPRARGALLLWFGAVIVALMIGLRYKVGGDWGSYAQMFHYSRGFSAHQIISIFGDPAYGLLTWSVSRAGGAIWEVNLVCGIIFAWGLVRFARTQTNPWLAMTIAIPYLVVVVAMGYTRQAVAIGILMAGLASVSRGASTIRFAMYVIAAALFHKTAAMVLPLMAFAQERNRLVNILAGLALSVLFYDLFLSESMNVLYRNYIKAEYSSQGAAIRVVLSAIPSALYLVSRRRFAFKPVESKLWFYFSITSLGLLLLLLAVPSSTAVDRMALYVIPIQMAIWSRVNVAYNLQRLGRVVVVGLSALILFTWLNFAVNAKHWVPYQLYPVFG